MWIADAARIRTIDKLAAAEFGIPAIVLMERAGMAVFESIQELLPDGGRIVFLCGKGNNGGDGIAAARLAHETGKYGVEVLISAEENALSNECMTQLNIGRTGGLQPIFVDDARYGRKLDCLGVNDLVVDAILGTGAEGHLHGHVLEAIQAINRSGVPVLSVDLPSGIDTNTGADLGESVWALRTVTFGLPKPCFFQGIGLEHAGYWSTADIGYPSRLTEEDTGMRLLSSHWVMDVIPERLRSAHKRDNGHILVIAGSDLMSGAAILAALGALRAGAGLVTIASTHEVCNRAGSIIPEAILHPLPSTKGCLGPDAADEILKLAERCDSAIFGPGLTQSPEVWALLDALWPRWEWPSCIDADALNAVAHGVALPACETVMTPHPGEMGRLLGCSIAEVQSDRFRTVREAVERFKTTLILKGPHTIIGSPHQPLAVNSTGNNGLATAGSGDVLSGVIGTLLAQDVPPYCAACAGAYWHGSAGDLCATDIGAIGYLASDVAAALPRARAKLLASCEGRSPVRLSPLPCSS